MIANKTRDNTNSKMILLAGAGFSYDLGYRKLKDQLINMMKTEGFISYLMNKVGQIGSIEMLINRLNKYKEIDNWIRWDDPILRDAYDVRLEMRGGDFHHALTSCYETLVKNYGPKDSNIAYQNKFRARAEILQKIAKANKPSNVLDIYTTNYDCAFQYMASEKDQPKLTFLTHISNEKVKNKDGEFKAGKWYDPMENYLDTDIRAYLPNVYIHRLHGCIAWYNKKEKGRVVSAHEKDGAGGTTPFVFEGDRDYFLYNLCIKLIGSEYLSAKEVSSSAFNEFYDQLTRIDTLLVWGYSFRDVEVLRQINHALLARKKPFRIYYISEIVSAGLVQKNIDEIKNNIDETLKNTPTSLSPDFIPIRLNWNKDLGYDALAREIEERNRNRYKN